MGIWAVAFQQFLQIPNLSGNGQLVDGIAVCQCKDIRQVIFSNAQGQDTASILWGDFAVDG